MVFFNYASMEMSAKIVYYGPGLCGKTTNLRWIYDQMPQRRRGEMVSLATETDRTLFFDLLPLQLGKVGDFTTRIQLYTVPGQVFYNSTRKLVLKGVDGVVFVADSQEPMLDANIESLENLQENLAEQKLNLRKIPWVIQYNKRDLPGILPINVLNRHVNFMDVPSYESVATTGVGVMESLLGIAKLTLRHLRKKAGEDLPEESGELLDFERELFEAFSGDEPTPPEPAAPVEIVGSDKSEEESVEFAPLPSEPDDVVEPDDLFFDEDDDVQPDESEKEMPESKPEPEAVLQSAQLTAPTPKVSVNLEPLGTDTPSETMPDGSVHATAGIIPVQGVEAEGLVLDKDVVQKIRIPIRLKKDQNVSHINLNLKLEVECVLVTEVAKKSAKISTRKAARLADKALEDFLMGKSKRKK